MPQAVPEGFKPMPHSGPFIDGVGPFYMKRSGSGWRFGMRAEARHTNPTGVTHGGLVITFLDHIMGRLVWETLRDRLGATVSLNVDLVAAARPGDWIEAEGEVTRASSSLVFVRGHAFAGEKTLATASGVWKVMGPR